MSETEVSATAPESATLVTNDHLLEALVGLNENLAAIKLLLPDLVARISSLELAQDARDIAEASR